MTKMGLLRRSSSQRRVDSGIWGKGWAPVGAQPFPLFVKKVSSLRWGLKNEISRSNPDKFFIFYFVQEQ